MTKPPRSPSTVPGFHLWHAALAWKAAVGEALAPHELTPTQFFVLGAIAWLGRTAAPSQRQVAEHAGLDAMTTSQVVRALAERGLVVRREHPTDTRALCLELTEAGRAAFTPAAAAVRAADAAFFASADDPEALAGVLRRLHDDRRQR